MKRCAYCGRRWRLRDEGLGTGRIACANPENCITRMTHRNRWYSRWL